MPISKDAYKLLVFIRQKPRTAEELSDFLKEKYCDNALYRELDSQGYWYLESKFHISEKGKVALESYKRLSKAELKASIAIGLSFVSLLVSAYIGLRS